jgi:hypothetical protein
MSYGKLFANDKLKGLGQETDIAFVFPAGAKEIHKTFSNR